MRKLSATITIFLISILLVSGCGVDNKNSQEKVKQEVAIQKRKDEQKRLATERKKQGLPAKVLPVASRPVGEVAVDGSTRGSLTALAANNYRNQGGTNSVSVTNNGEQAAFKELCEGKIDIADSSRPINKKEWLYCRQHGLNVIQFQVASDAIIIAMKSETDTGADCLTTEQVKNIYRAGSPIYNWNQMGFYNIPLKTAGPDENNNAFGFFGKYILGSSQPSMTDFRSDYRRYDNDRGVREFVVGKKEDYLKGRNLVSTKTALRATLTRQTKAKRSYTLAKREVKKAKFERAKGIKDRRSPAQQEKDAARIVKAEKNFASAKAWLSRTKKEVRKARLLFKDSNTSQKRINKLVGRLGFFRFSYYEMYEDQLRPLEITLPTGGKNCIFPSQRTVTNAVYPFARQLLLTVTTRGLKRNEVSEFIKDYMQRSQKLAVNQRLVPLPDDVLAKQRAWINGDIKPAPIDYLNNTNTPKQPRLQDPTETVTTTTTQTTTQTTATFQTPTNTQTTQTMTTQP